MISRHDFSRLILAGFIGMAAASPASALTKSGNDLLERLRGRVDPKAGTATVIEAPVVIEPPSVSDSSPSAKDRFEPGTISTPPSPETGMEPKKVEPASDPGADDQSAKKQDRKEKQTKPDNANQQKPTTNDLLGKPPAIETPSDKLAGKKADTDMQEVLDKLEALRKRLETGPSKNRKKGNEKPEKSLKQQEPPKKPQAPEIATVTPEARAPEPVSLAKPISETAVSPVSGSARSFGELSDAELIQYAQEHVWSAEKSRKHNPPVTPSAKSKKKKKEVKQAPAKASPQPTTKPASKKAAGTVIIKKAVR